MTLLYCTDRARAYLRYKREMVLVDVELDIACAMTRAGAYGYNRRTTQYVRGKGYKQLPKPMRNFIENNYQEYLPN